RVGNEHHSGLGGQGLEHGGKVVAVIPGGNAKQPRPEEVGDDGINREAILRDHYVHARSHQGVPDKLDDFIRAVAQNEVFRIEGEFLGQLLFQVKRVAIRVEEQV